MALQLRSGPAIEPLSLVDTKNFLRVDGSDDDILVASLIAAARVYIETTIGKILINENWSYFIDKWPTSGTLYLPLSPVQSIEEIRLHENGEAYEVFDPTNYVVDLISHQPRIKLINLTAPPVTGAGLNQIEVRFAAGFGDLESDVPEDLRQAMLMLCAHWYEQREPVGFGGSFNEIPTTITALMNNYKSYRVQ